MNWQTVTISIIGSGIFSAIVTAVVNGWMNHRTQIIAIKESGLYSKRAEVLDGLMKKMQEMDGNVAVLISPLQVDSSVEVRYKKLREAADSFNVFYQEQRLVMHYLPKELSDDISKLCEEYKNLLTSYFIEVNPSSVTKPNLDRWSELNNKHKFEFTKKQEDVANEFRKLIGVK